MRVHTTRIPSESFTENNLIAKLEIPHDQLSLMINSEMMGFKLMSSPSL